MSSLIPKISIGRDTKKGSHFDLSSMTHTTSEIGYVQPTFSKFLVPNSSVRIGTRTGVRLSPLFVPTMGQIDVRHYHDFIPFNTLWFPFDAFITKTNYTLPSGSTYIPDAIPHFSVKALFTFLFNEFGVTDGKWVDLQNDLVCTIYKYDTDSKVYTAIPSSVINGQNNSIFSINDFVLYPRSIYQPNGDTYVHLSCQGNSTGTIRTTPYELLSWHVIPTPDACDFCYQARYNDPADGVTPCLITFNFCGCVKRLRTAFLGLGYSFNPFDTEQVTPLALLAFYKMYWEHFGVNRTFNFFNTNCYKVIKYLSEHIVGDILRFDASSPEASTLFTKFVVDLANMTYTCAPDYFSSADVDTQRSASQSGGYKFTSPLSAGSNINHEYGASSEVNVLTKRASPVSTDVSGAQFSTPSVALAQKIAQRLLRFVNKNSVIGREISEILRTRYGVTDIHNTTHEDVIKVGASSCPIEISAVYNNTDSGDMPLGSYAGLGVGSRRSKMFKFHTDTFGIVITMSAVVPKMGYWQGMLRENSDGVNGSFDFYTPEFDALGWQSVRYNELVADRQHSFDFTLPSTDLGIFGFQPFYSHMKVGHNRCLGDISIPHLRESMLPYTLDRYFPDHERFEDGALGTSLLPPNDPQTFRSGTQGHTNRIFSDYSETDDHVIMQIFFDVKMTAPMKSLSTSYDTWDEESTSSVEVSHE